MAFFSILHASAGGVQPFAKTASVQWPASALGSAAVCSAPKASMSDTSKKSCRNRSRSDALSSIFAACQLIKAIQNVFQAWMGTLIFVNLLRQRFLGQVWHGIPLVISFEHNRPMCS